MGFGGSAQSMITILKNNEKMRSQRKKRKAFEGSYSNIKLEFPNKATKQDLKQIAKKMKKEYMQVRLKRILVLGFVLLMLVIIYIKLSLCL